MRVLSDPSATVIVVEHRLARFEIPDGWIAQAYQFALDPTPRQIDALVSHAGGARFAYNTMLAAVKANLDQRAAEGSYKIAEVELTPCMSWSFQSLRNDWNRRNILPQSATMARHGGRTTPKRYMPTLAGH